MTRTRLLSSAAGFLALTFITFSSVARASDGRIPIYEPTTISYAGSYYLTQEVGGDISIEATDVTLDLNGFRLGGDVWVTGTSRVRISGGRVLGRIVGVNAIDLAVERVEVGTIALISAMNPTIELVKCAGMTLTAMTSGRVARCTVIGGTGIWLIGGESCEVVDNTVSGATLALGNNGRSHIVSRNTVNASPSYGIEVNQSSNNRVIGNTVRGSTWSGLYLFDAHGNQVAENDVASCGSGDAPYGVWLASSTMNELSRNMVHDGAGSGIRLSSGSWGNNLIYNSANNNGLASAAASGILVEADDNVLDWNVANGNRDYGIRVTGARNVLSHNRALRNGAASWDVSCATNYCVHYYDGGYTMSTSIPGLP